MRYYPSQPLAEFHAATSFALAGATAGAVFVTASAITFCFFFSPTSEKDTFLGRHGPQSFAAISSTQSVSAFLYRA